jgi:hypothetical protein
MGAARQCFRNSVRLALRRPRFYTYVEGYAINKWAAGRPVAHAWCVDPEGFVVDTTWDEGADYFARLSGWSTSGGWPVPGGTTA